MKTTAKSIEVTARHIINYKKILLVTIITVALLFSGLFFLYQPTVVKGSDNSLFKNDTTYFSEKLTYLFRPPQLGEVVIFTTDKYPNMEYIGVIVNVSDKYTIVNRLNSTNPWIVNRSQIIGHIYFPRLQLPRAPENLLPTPTLMPTPTLIPTTIPTRRPTRVPSKVPTKSPTSSTQNTSVPTSAPIQSSNNNNFYCFINAQAQNEGVPSTYNLVCGVGNLGSATSAEFQWDYNGDGNWDSDFSQSNCSTNYTYTTQGIYNVKMKAKTPDGQIAECTTSIGIQPH